MHYKEILSKLIQSRLFITREALMAELARIYMASYADIELPKYADKTKEFIKKMSEKGFPLTDKFDDLDIPADSIALHRIVGIIYSEYDDWGWFFSTRQFIDDLKAADSNPNIIAHFVYVNSGGGDAYMLDIAAGVMNSLSKPVIAYSEEYNCSAAYYLVCRADAIYTSNRFDTIGSIGTMVAFWDIKPAFEKMGLVWHEHYAHQSDLKNKKINDLLDGKPEQFINEELDPLAADFISAVKSARAKTANKKDIFRGETWYAEEAVENGLIDGIFTMEQALQETIRLVSDKKAMAKHIAQREKMLELII